MASSQVEIAPSPFAVPSSSSSSTSSCFQKLVTSKSRHIDLWVHRPQWQTTTTTTTIIADNESCDDNNNHDSIHHHKDKWARAREIVLSADHPKKHSVEVSTSGGGVSSLVQKWRGFEAKRSSNGNGNGNGNASTCTSTSSSNSSSTCRMDNNVCDQPPPTPAPSLDDAGDWESSSAAFITAPRDATEIERLRVADIIRRLTDNDSPPRVRTTSSSDQSCASPVVNSPRIRGRQAFNDLLMQMERDRHKELERLVARKAVSKFSHRGRIQALLRFRFLRRGMEAKEGLHSNVKSSESHKPMKQPSIMHIRERVNPSAQNVSVHSGKELIDNICSAQNVSAADQHGNENQYNEVTDSKRCIRVMEEHMQEGSITCKEHNVEQSCPKFNEDAQQNIKQLQHLDCDISPSSTLTRIGTYWENSNHILASEEISVHLKEEKATNDQVIKNICDPISDCAEPHGYHEGESVNNQHLVDSAMYWITDVSNPEVGWEEFHSDEQRNREWIDEVSRPRSDWEGLRQARYQEMLDPFLDNEEIRVLLGRRSVSAFLSSGLREKIDRVIVSRSQGQQTLKNDQTQEDKHERLAVQAEEEDEDEQDEGDNCGDNFDEYEEAESSVGKQYNNESDDYTELIMSSPQNQGQESSDYSYQVASPSTRQSSSNYYSQDNRPNSSDNSAHPEIDMELIYDLRGHMEQLHQEMSELRKSIKCCVDMQIKLQRSIKKEVAVALHHSEAKNGRWNAVKKVTSGGRCCVCCKMQVDSLLYRCGHMCTCFTCAHKLHWSSGKCPICRAPILDVVRTYSNHS